MRILAFLFCFLAWTDAPIAQVPPAPQKTPPRTVAPSRALVATHYYYWYQWPDAHFREGFHNHFVAPETVDYMDPDWHCHQFEEMAACGIDCALPVYWGVPGSYEKPDIRFAVDGLPPMVKALEELERRGAPSVKIGMFYDTNTLKNEVRGILPRDGLADLTKDAGKALFCGTVLGFFERVPKRFWVRWKGRPLVVLWVGTTAIAYDKTLGPALRAAFARRFPGERVLLVADSTWGDIGQDRTTSWGAALHGPRVFPGVVQIGPGYDDRDVPGRTGPRRDREGGNFYRHSWRAAIAARPELVLIETWNEMHEGTEICASAELGRRYLDLTKEWIGRLRSGDLGPEITLKNREPSPRPDFSWGREAVGADRVFADYTCDPPRRCGLREIPWKNGLLRVDRLSLRPGVSRHGEQHVYFQVADFYRFNCEERIEITVDAVPIDGHPLELEYDSRDETARNRGAYTKARARILQGQGGVRRIVFDLPRARLANRQNDGGDFYLRVRNVRAAIHRIEVRAVTR